MEDSGVVRGVAGVAKATPIFQLLLNKIVLKISTKNFLFIPENCIMQITFCGKSKKSVSMNWMLKQK